MSIKSTVRLTREDAVRRYIDYKAERKKRKWLAEATALSDTDLENILERWNDERSREDFGGESGFDNYLIVPAEEL